MLTAEERLCSFKPDVSGEPVKPLGVEVRLLCDGGLSEVYSRRARWAMDSGSDKLFNVAGARVAAAQTR